MSSGLQRQIIMLQTSTQLLADANLSSEGLYTDTLSLSSPNLHCTGAYLKARTYDSRRSSIQDVHVREGQDQDQDQDHGSGFRMIQEARNGMFRDRRKGQRPPKRRRRGHWDPFTQNGGIYEDVDVSAPVGANAENGVSAMEWPYSEKSVRGEGVEANIRDRTLADSMRSQQNLTRHDRDKGCSSTKIPNASTKCRRRDEGAKSDLSRLSFATARVPEESLLSEKVESLETAVSKKRAKNLGSDHSTFRIKSAAASSRVLRQRLSDRYQLNYDTMYDRPGQGAGKENVPPGAGEYYNENIEKPFKTTKIRPTVSSRLPSARTPIPKQTAMAEKRLTLTSPSAEENTQGPETAIAAPEKRINPEKTICDHEDDCVSTAYPHAGLCNWTTRAVQISQMANQNLKHDITRLFFNSEMNVRTTSIPELIVSCTRSDSHQRQNTSSRQVTRQSTGELDIIVPLESRPFQYDLLNYDTIQHSAFPLVFQTIIIQQQYCQTQIQTNSRIPQSLLPLGHFGRSQRLHDQSNTLKDDISNTALYLKCPKQIHIHLILPKMTGPLGLEEPRGSLTLNGIQFNSLSLDISNFQISNTRKFTKGLLPLLPLDHQVRRIRTSAAAKMAPKPPSTRNLSFEIHHAIILPVNYKLDLRFLMSSTQDRHAMLFHVTCMYSYAFVNQIVHTALCSMLLGMRRYLNMIFEFWSWSIISF